MADTCSYLRSVNTTTSRKKLWTNFFINTLIRLIIKKSVPQVVTTTDNLNFIQKVTVNCWEASTAVIHLACENFISEEVIAENSAIRVWEIVTVSHRNINKIT